MLGTVKNIGIILLVILLLGGVLLVDITAYCMAYAMLSDSESWGEVIAHLIQFGIWWAIGIVFAALWAKLPSNNNTEVPRGVVILCAIIFSPWGALMFIIYVGGLALNVIEESFAPHQKVG